MTKVRITHSKTGYLVKLGNKVLREWNELEDAKGYARGYEKARKQLANK